ncbi:MAG TPA: hypothetical protein PLA94_13245 [Myxococcota bacterium]|nr:hypothetical protein [Myxococcota bacterium]
MTEAKDRWTLLACLLLVLIPTWTLALPNFTTGLLGFETVDHYGTQWFYWFAQYHLENGLGIAHTDLFFHPWGKDIYGHTGANLLDAYIDVPFRKILGPVLGYNLFVVFGMVVSGMAFYRMARRYVSDRLILAVGTLLFTHNPYILYEILDGRPTQAILLFPILFFDRLLQSGEQRGWRSPLLAGLWLALTGYQYWYYAIFCGLMALAHGLYLAARPGPESGGALAVLIRHAGIAAFSLVLCLPAALPLVLATLEAGKVPGLLDTDLWTLWDTPPVTKEGTLIGLFLWQPLAGSSGFYVRDVTDATEHFLPCLFPLPMLLLPIFLHWNQHPGSLRRGPLLIMLVTSVIVGMGPMVVIADQVFTNPFYVVLAKSVSFIRRLWWPGRIAGMATILGFLVLPVALAGHRHRRPAALAVSFTMALTLFGAKLLPLPTWEADIPAGYRCLATGPKGAVMELPYAFTQAHLYYQTIHQRPIFGGMIEDNPVFTPDEFIELRKKNTFVQRVLELTRLMKSDVEWTEEDKEAMKDLGYRYVVVQKDAFTTSPKAPEAQKELQAIRLRKLERDLRAMMGNPVFSDARSSIFAPWGDPVPCDIATVGLDKEGQMAPYIDPAARLGEGTGVISRLFGEAQIIGNLPVDQAGAAPVKRIRPGETADGAGSSTGAAGTDGSSATEGAEGTQSPGSTQGTGAEGTNGGTEGSPTPEPAATPEANPQ